MPIFHEDDRLPPEDSSAATTAQQAQWHGASSPEEGFKRLSDGTMGAVADGRPISREELIERIKRGESPSWTATFNLRSPAPAHQPLPSTPPKPTSSLLPSPPIKDSPAKDELQLTVDHNAGYSIERPRSALHKGDFREDHDDEQGNGHASNVLSTSPVAPWHTDFARRSFWSSASPSPSPLRLTERDRAQDGAHQVPWSFATAQTRDPSSAWQPLPLQPLQTNVSPLSAAFSTHVLPGSATRPARTRATSYSSLSTSFVLRHPTSPLVQQSNNTDLDFSPNGRSVPRSPSPEHNRRHTFSPLSLQSLPSHFEEVPPSGPGRPIPPLRKEGAFPHQAHQPRRSVSNLMTLQPTSTPQTPMMRPRRPSMSLENSPLHHAPMVGSYEESILRGRMSTAPSRTLNFVAQIGVLGKGDCKASLRCPPHAILPFPAVFYSYNSTNNTISRNEPSPYVGVIDIESSIPSPKDPKEERRRRRLAASGSDTEDLSTTTSVAASPFTNSIPSGISNGLAEARRFAERRRQEKRRRRSTSPRAPPGGSYRIPAQGQLQIVIKNPNKTAVKLFLVPYDLTDMPPGTKTFIRQRSYSAGPVIDMPLTSRTNLGTDRPEASLGVGEDPTERPVLRYLIHLNICCVGSKGRERYFLYRSVRVVFANRVPDGKERLRNEMQMPEPRWAIYRPGRESNVGLHS